MRTPWALVAAFALGAAAGAAVVALLRGPTGQELHPAAPEGAPPAAPDQIAPAYRPTRDVAAALAPAPAPARTPNRSMPPALSAVVPRTPVPMARPGTANSMDLSLDALLDRLEGLAREGAYSPGPTLDQVIAALANRFPDARIRPGLYEALRRRVPGVGRLAEYLSDGDLLALLRKVGNDMSEGVPAWKLNEMEFDALTQALARRGAIKGPTMEEFAAHPHPRVRRSAAVLAEWPPERTDVLLGLARDPDTTVRATAFYMIEELLGEGKASAPEFEELVLSGLKDPFADVRNHCQDMLLHYGERGAAEAVRILRAGENRETGNGPEDLVRAALARGQDRLLAEPLTAHLAEDLCIGCGSLSEDRPDLVRLLAPHALRLIAALEPGSAEAAGSLLAELARAGQPGVVREILQAPDLSASIRQVAVKALLECSPPAEWEAAVSLWFRDTGVSPKARWELLREVGAGPSRDEADPTRAEVAAAWVRVLQEVSRGADELLAEEASRILTALAKR